MCFHYRAHGCSLTFIFRTSVSICTFFWVCIRGRSEILAVLSVTGFTVCDVFFTDSCVCGFWTPNGTGNICTLLKE